MKFLILNNHKLNLNQFPENYHLIAIHSDLDEFRLAFFLNKKLNIGLKRKINDIYFSEQDAKYSSYEFLDDTKYLKWIFFSNKSLVFEKTSEENLGYHPTLPTWEPGFKSRRSHHLFNRVISDENSDYRPDCTHCQHCCDYNCQYVGIASQPASGIW